MKNKKKPYYYDLCRYSSSRLSHEVAFIKAFRNYSNSGFVLKKLCARLQLIFFREIYGMEIPRTVKIGKGFYIGHGWNITINPKTVIGNNVNIHKGVTIGQENRGKRKGTPIIGNYVWIGINSTVVGKVKIGDNVLIAPNSYVNCDVPDNSIVIGNPCKIIPCETATEGYISNIV